MYSLFESMSKSIVLSKHIFANYVAESGLIKLLQ